MKHFKMHMTLGLVAAAALLVLRPAWNDTQVLAGRAKPPAIPKFQLQYWDIPNRDETHQPSVGSMNVHGQIAGFYVHNNGAYRGYLYDPKISATTAMDLESTFGTAGLPEGWQIERAVTINDDGVISGYMTTIDPETGVKRGWPFLLDTLADNPEVVPMPDVTAITSCYPTDFNNAGDILCRYSLDGKTYYFFFNPALDSEPYFQDQPVASGVALSNPTANQPAQVMLRLLDGSLQRWIPEWNTLAAVGVSGIYVDDVNDAGHVAGQYQTRPMRLITPPPQKFGLGYANAYSINNSDDVAIDDGYIYRDDTGYIYLKTYLSGSKADKALWASAILPQRQMH